MLRFLLSSVGSWLIFLVKIPGSLIPHHKDEDRQRFLQSSEGGGEEEEEEDHDQGLRTLAAILNDTRLELDQAHTDIGALQTELQASGIAQRALEKVLEGKLSELKRLQEHLKVQNGEHNGKLLQLQQEVEKLRQRNRELEWRNRKLEEDIKSLEQEKAKYYIGGESFCDSGPTPHLLVGAVECVQQAVTSFAKLFVDSLRKLEVNCDLMARNLVPPDIILDVTAAADRKFVFQSFISHIMFSEFENECFGVQAYQSRTLDHEQYRSESFGQYKHLRNVEDPGQLVYLPAPDSFFRSFCIQKYDTLTRELRSYINTLDPDGNVARIRFKMEQKFIKLAQCVWLIHRLAFSFDLTARIFRVAPGISFDEMYMHSVVMGHGYDEEDDDDGDAGDARAPREVVVPTVGLMVVPGFFVRRIIVRSSVYLVVTKPLLSSTNDKAFDHGRPWSSSTSSRLPEHQASTVTSENNTTKDPEAAAATDDLGLTSHQH